MELWSVARRRAKAGVAEVGVEVVLGSRRRRIWLLREREPWSDVRNWAELGVGKNKLRRWRKVV